MPRGMGGKAVVGTFGFETSRSHVGRGEIGVGGGGCLRGENRGTIYKRGKHRIKKLKG